MKASDLRLGNLYMRGNKVEEFTDQVMHEVIYGALQHCEPIPLTEDWLVKFGFEQGLSNHFRIDLGDSDKYYLLCNPVRNDWSEVCVGIYSAGQAPTKYVHQLQNLYFALTGEELSL